MHTPAPYITALKDDVLRRCFDNHLFLALIAPSFAAAGGARLERLQHLVHTETSGLLAGRVLLEALDELTHDDLGGNEHPELVSTPAEPHHGFAREPLKRVLAQVDYERHVGLL